MLRSTTPEYGSFVPALPGRVRVLMLRSRGSLGLLFPSRSNRFTNGCLTNLIAGLSQTCKQCFHCKQVKNLVTKIREKGFNQEPLLASEFFSLKRDREGSITVVING